MCDVASGRLAQTYDATTALSSSSSLFYRNVTNNNSNNVEICAILCSVGDTTLNNNDTGSYTYL